MWSFFLDEFLWCLLRLEDVTTVSLVQRLILLYFVKKYLIQYFWLLFWKTTNGSHEPSLTPNLYLGFFSENIWCWLRRGCFLPNEIMHSWLVSPCYDFCYWTSFSTYTWQRQDGKKHAFFVAFRNSLSSDRVASWYPQKKGRSFLIWNKEPIYSTYNANICKLDVKCIVPWIFIAVKSAHYSCKLLNSYFNMYTCTVSNCYFHSNCKSLFFYLKKGMYESQ
jgi:hypothetical protein